MKLRIFPKMIVGILFPAVVAIVVMCAVSIQTASVGMHNQVFEMLRVSSSLQQKDLSSTLNILRHGVMSTFTDSTRIRNYLTAIQTDTDAETLTILKAQMDSYVDQITKNYDQISYSCVLDPKGKVVASTSASAVITYADFDFFKKAMGGQQAIQNLVSKGDVTTIIANPIFDDEVNKKNITGIACIFLNLSHIADPASIKLGQTGTLYVLDYQGNMLMHSDPAMVGTDDSADPFTKKVISEKNGSGEYTRFDTERFGAFADIPEASWVVVVMMSKAEATATINEMTNLSLITGLIVLLIVGFIIFYMANSFAKSLNGGVMFTKIVMESDFIVSPQLQAQIDVDLTRGDELAELAKGIYQMVLSVRAAMDKQEEQTLLANQAVEKAKIATQEAEEARLTAESAKHEGMLSAARQLEGVVHIVSSASNSVSEHIKRSNRNSHEASDRIAQTATAMEEMNSTVSEVARNASLASSTSSKTKENALNGEKIVQEVIVSIQEVEHTSLVLKSDMEALTEQAKAISHIMRVISDIADQTNILAINAAIEAARAGETGRGFAVVADEVRKLAENTILSITDVAKVIKAIQESTHKSMTQVDTTVQFIEKATSLAVKSGESLKEIVQMVEMSEDQVRAIATACEEQSATSDEISRSLGEVNNISSDSTTAMQEANSSVQELTHQANVLTNLIDDMKRG